MSFKPIDEMYTVRYCYKDICGNYIRDESSYDNEEQAIDFMKRLSIKRKLESLYLIVDKKYI